MSGSASLSLGAKGGHTFANHLALNRKLAEEKQNGGRRASPDSDALVSSDEEHSRVSALDRVKAQNTTHPPRRASWLNEIKPVQRKFSLGQASVNSTGSQPQTPAGEQEWNALSRPPAVPTLTWGADIWAMDKKRDSVSHNDALTSPTALSHQETDDEPAPLPVQIPLAPTLKTYRSQSYSVGQEDPEQMLQLPMPNPGRMRSIAVPQQYLISRNSRPSLGSVMEDEGDHPQMDENAHQPASLRKQATLESASRFHMPFTSPFSRETDHAVDDIDEIAPDSTVRPRTQEQAAGSKRAHWNSSLGFGHIPEGIQSRRHSMHVPNANQNDGAEASGPGIGRGPSPGVREQLAQRLHSLTLNRAQDSKFTHRSSTPQEHIAVGHSPSPLAQPPTITQMHKSDGVPLSALATPFFPAHHYPYLYTEGVANTFTARFSAPSYELADHTDYSRSAHAAHMMHGAPAQHGFMHNPPPRKYYVVSFKCGRSEIFYIPTHMGLVVKAGEMVIVEGDRGQDIGSVVHGDVSERDAKRVKRDSDHEHFKWLMMYSRANPAGRNGFGTPAINPMAETRGHDRDGEFKPKMIKRLAHQHEINGLKEKEGLEARAKRTCASKVSDHGLQMEILDAEYQLDYKKLTFYFYAETYVNFNDLVQDLFKQFKTRIWLAAINPAAFPVAPTIPSAVAPGVTNSNQPAVQQAPNPSHGPAAVARRAAGLSGTPDSHLRQQWYPNDNRGMYTVSPGTNIVGPSDPRATDAYSPYMQQPQAVLNAMQQQQQQVQQQQAQQSLAYGGAGDWRPQYDARYHHQQSMGAPGPQMMPGAMQGQMGQMPLQYVPEQFQQHGGSVMMGMHR